MSGVANPARGETALQLGERALVVRPSFQALVAAEGELGPLFELVERAAAGRLGIGEVAGLLWHCLVDAEDLERDRFGEALVEAGLKVLAPVLAQVIRQILAGR